MLLRARWVIPVEGTPLERHAVLVRDGRIQEIAPWDRMPAGEELVDLPEHALIPGLINAHTHAASVLRRGQGDDLANPRDAREVFDGTQLACEEMLRGGITCFGDAFYFPDAAIEAIAAAGLRCSHGLLVSEHASAYASDAADYLSKGLAARDRHRDSPRLSFRLVARGADEAMLRQVATLAAELDIPVQVEAAPPIERLQRTGLLGPSLIVTSASGLSAPDIAALGRHGCSVVHCPSADLKQHRLPADPAALLAAGATVALGTGGAASNHRLDLFHEMSICGLAPHDALRAATLGGARALGIDRTTGSIAPGKAADLVAVALGGPELAAGRDPLALLVYSAGRQHVTHVWVDGQPVLVL